MDKSSLEIEIENHLRLEEFQGLNISFLLMGQFILNCYKNLGFDHNDQYPQFLKPVSPDIVIGTANDLFRKAVDLAVSGNTNANAIEFVKFCVAKAGGFSAQGLLFDEADVEQAEFASNVNGANLYYNQAIEKAASGEGIKSETFFTRCFIEKLGGYTAAGLCFWNKDLEEIEHQDTINQARSFFQMAYSRTMKGKKNDFADTSIDFAYIYILKAAGYGPSIEEHPAEQNTIERAAEVDVSIMNQAVGEEPVASLTEKQWAEALELVGIPQLSWNKLMAEWPEKSLPPQTKPHHHPLSKSLH